MSIRSACATPSTPADKRDRVVTVHGKADGTLTERLNAATLQSNVRGYGGLFSTAGDYGIFMQLFLNGGRRGATRLISEASVHAMRSNRIGTLVVDEQPSANPAIARPFPLGSGNDKFGLGFQIETAPTPSRIADRGLRSVGSYSWAASTTRTSGSTRRGKSPLPFSCRCCRTTTSGA